MLMKDYTGERVTKKFYKGAVSQLKCAMEDRDSSKRFVKKI